MTFSIVAKCADSGQFGVAISSSSLCVAARCAFVRAGVGAVASQNITDPRLGTRALDLMTEGKTATQVRDKIVQSAANIEYRQLLIVDNTGEVAQFSGSNTLGVNALAQTDHAMAAGNLLQTSQVPQAMIDGFLATKGELLGTRLIAAMNAGRAAGGEAGPVTSAGLLIADRQDWPLADLRIDQSNDPIGDLSALWRDWQPEMDAYVTRAITPDQAPSYGVPGDK
jgi:uncharacterized Ntn-hydrolase superfamily protein